MQKHDSGVRAESVLPTDKPQQLPLPGIESRTRFHTRTYLSPLYRYRVQIALAVLVCVPVLFMYPILLLAPIGGAILYAINHGTDQIADKLLSRGGQDHE